MNLEWMLIRGTGLVAYGLLAASTIWGLLVSSKLLGRAVKARGLTWLHEGLAVGALLSTGAHMFFLWADDFIEFGPRELFIPGASTWEPLPVAFGIMAFYVAIVVSGSFYVKQWIGQAAWRAIHFLAFGTFAAAAIHGITAGTDTQHPVVLGMYVGTVAVVVMLLIVRTAQEAAAHAPGASLEPSPQRVARSAPTRPAAARISDAAGRSDMSDRLAALQARRSNGPVSSQPPPVPDSAEVSPEMQERLAALDRRDSETHIGDGAAGR